MIKIIRSKYNKLKYYLFNKITFNNLSKEKKIKVSPQNLFNQKLKLYMYGTDLFHDTVNPLISYCNLAKIDLLLFRFFYKRFPTSYITKILIKHRAVGSFKIINSYNGEILCIRNFVWVFGILIWEESLFLGYNGITSELITDKYLLLIRDLELRYQGSYDPLDIMPVSFAFEVEGFLPEKAEDFLNLSKWDFCQSKSVTYPKKP